MAGKISVNELKLGDSATDSQNFLLKTNADGTATLARGATGSLGDILTVDATGKVTLAGGSNEIGVGQTWTDVTGSRLSATNYTNNTGKPIQVMVLNSTASITAIVVGGVTIHSGTAANNVSFIVPDGEVYNVTTATVTYWAELR